MDATLLATLGTIFGALIAAGAGALTQYLNIRKENSQFDRQHKVEEKLRIEEEKKEYREKVRLAYTTSIRNLSLLNDVDNDEIDFENEILKKFLRKLMKILYSF